MEIQLITALKIQLVLNIISFLLFIYLIYKTIKLVFSVKKGNIKDNQEKKERIKRLGISSFIFLILFLIINILFQLDPLNIIQDPIKGLPTNTLEEKR